MEEKCIVKMVDVADIRVVNSRHREAKKYAEIRESINVVGLKTPIVVAPRREESDKLYYELVCGEGRLGIYKAQGMEKIPARIIEADKQDLLLMSLVENFARKQYNKIALVNEIIRLTKERYGIAEISRKLGVSQSHLFEIMKLIKRNETQLLRAVVTGRMTVTTAVLISECSNDSAVQKAINDAYEKKEIKASALRYIRAVLKNRTDGAIVRKPIGDKRRGEAFITDCKKEIQRGVEFLKKASLYENNLAYIKGAFFKVLDDECFVNLMISQKIGSVPEVLMEVANGR